jgi:hypothetical protein
MKKEMSEQRSGRVFRRSLNGALYVRIETTLFLCVHSCSFVVKLNRYGSAGLAGRHASVARQNRKTPLFFWLKPPLSRLQLKRNSLPAGMLHEILTSSF